MQTALKLKTMVSNRGKLEISASGLPIGEAVEVIILFPISPPAPLKQSVVDILDRSPGQRIFKNAEDVDNYLKQERNAWNS